MTGNHFNDEKSDDHLEYVTGPFVVCRQVIQWIKNWRNKNLSANVMFQVDQVNLVIITMSKLLIFYLVW